MNIYTDGACSNNPGPGGWGFAIIEGDQLTTLPKDFRLRRPIIKWN